MRADVCPVQTGIGSSHASDPPGPGGVSVFCKPKAGDKVRLVLPDNVAVCVDNTGIEEWFDEGIEYVFEQRAGGMISAHDRTGVLRECLESRFDVKSSKDLFVLRTHFKVRRAT